MNKRLTILMVMLILIGLMGTVSAISQSDFQNIVFSDNRGNTNEATHGHVVYNIGKGWNIVPLKFIMESSGRYWGNFKEGQTCEQDIFQNVWYYSPVRMSNYHIPVMDDWGAPKTRNNEVLLNEFKAKYYHIYAGSAWIYSPKNCILEGDDGTSLVSGSYSDAEQEKGYQHKELVLKAGWNLVPVDVRMVVYEKSLKDLFSSCGAQKFYIYDKANNKWVDMTVEVDLGNKLVPSDIFRTYLVRTTRDCNLADYEASSSSSPPAFPSESSSTTSSNPQTSSSINTFGFPKTIGEYSLIEARDKGPNAGKQCGNIEDHIDSAQSGLKGEICHEGLSLQYDNPATSQGLFVGLVKVTKGLDLYKALYGKFSKPVTVDGQQVFKQVFRLENHEIVWYTSGEFDVIFTREYTSKNKENGKSYSYGTATGNNDVTKYFLNKFKPN